MRTRHGWLAACGAVLLLAALPGQGAGRAAPAPEAAGQSGAAQAAAAPEGGALRPLMAPAPQLLPLPPQARPGGPHRPKVALVLSGGGARGFAHIGVLRVLQELHIPVDFVVGTSMGSVVGGAYAAGSSVARLEQLVRRTDWNAVIADRPPRDQLAYRRREEDRLLPSRIEFGVEPDGLTLPPAAAGNEALELALTSVLPAGTRDKPVNQLQLPFRSVASDLVTGELVELGDTPLFQTMRASLAVPGVFAPVRVKQRLLVDGGLVRNLPVDVARAMGADVVIAVNVGTPLAPEKELGSAIGVAQQMLQILTEQNVQRSLRELGPNDILLAPSLDGISFLDFSRHDRAIRAGEAAARGASARLLQLALPEADYIAYEQSRLAAPPAADQARTLVGVRVEPSGNINPTVLEVQSGLKVGQAVTVEQAQEAGASLFARGDLARVETEVYDGASGRSVVIKPTEAEWAQSRLRLGLELSSDFSDNSDFELKALYVRSSLNDWDGELRLGASIGTNRTLGVQWWQPLGPGSQWYLTPALQYGAASADLFSDSGFRRARQRYNYNTRSIGFGRQLGNWGDLRLSVGRESVSSHLSIPEDLSVATVRRTVHELAFNVDTLDSIAFPTRGTLFSLDWARSSRNGGSAIPLSQQSVQGLEAFHTGRWAGHVYAEWARSQSGPAPLSLGGFLRLSGTAPESLAGNRVVLGRVVMARSIGAMPATLGGQVRLGFSLEAGGGYGPGNPLHWGSLRQAASGFVAVDTRFGPLYFGAGTTKGSTSSLYMFLGPIW
jgi:NTE family protein